jgi:hypothetical protein
MRHTRARALLIVQIIVAGIAVGCDAGKKTAGSNNDREALAKTSVAIRQGFARGDVAAILTSDGLGVDPGTGATSQLKKGGRS